MKKSIFLFVLMLLLTSNSIFSQELQSYIVEFDTLINLDKYMDSNKFIDKEKIKNDNFVTIKVYDVLGKVVATLVDENKPAGFYTVNFDASKLSSGVYFYSIKTDEFFDRKKMILLR